MSRYGSRTRVGQAVSDFGQLPSAGIGYGVATGGTSSSITVSSENYTLLTFTSTDTLTVTSAGLFDVLVCAGGGAGGSSNNDNRCYGGGGAGGIVEGTIYLSADTTITVGAGGASVTNDTGLPGSGSSIDSGARSLGAVGGGGGSGINNSLTQSTSGASGGGGGNTVAIYGGKTVSTVQGNNGGDGNNTLLHGGAGGGGATAAGANGTANCWCRWRRLRCQRIYCRWRTI
jgi:hypothetical protein